MQRYIKDLVKDTDYNHLLQAIGHIISFLHCKLHPSSRGRLNRGIRVQYNPALLLRFVEVKRHAPFLRLRSAENPAIEYHLDIFYQPEASCSLSKLLSWQSNRNGHPCEISGTKRRAWQRPRLAHRSVPVCATAIAQSACGIALTGAILTANNTRWARFAAVPRQLWWQRDDCSVAPTPTTSISPALVQQICHSDEVEVGHSGKTLSK